MTFDSPIVRHGRQPRANPWLRLIGVIASIAGVVAVSAVGVVGLQAVQAVVVLQNDSFELAGGSVPSIGEIEGGLNMLVVGSDQRDGNNSMIGGDGASLNDVNMIVHIPDDHSSIVVVSFPRDLMVPLPECENPETGATRGASTQEQINTALPYGMKCVVDTFQNLTGLNIQYAAKITMNGVIRMADAVGGVDVCITGGDLYDPDSKVYDVPGGRPLSLTEGEHTITGAEALAFLRSRHGVADGSDLGRISSQQQYMSSLLRKLDENGTLTDPGQLYALANAAIDTASTGDLTLSSSLASLDTMVALAGIVRDVPLKKIAFVQYPTVYGTGEFASRVFPATPAADEMMTALQEDRFVIANNGGSGKSGGKKTQNVDTTGQLATDTTCAVANN